MDNIFEWGPQYSVGNEMIDAQHQKLFEIGMSIMDAEEDDVQGVMSEILQIVSEHFFTEEEYMKKIGYPKIQEHILLHKKFWKI